MTDTLTITKTAGRVTIFHLAGRLDAQTQESLLNAARQAHEAGTKFLLFDLQNLEMITSAGLGALHNIYKLFTSHDEAEAWEREHRGEIYKSPYFKLAGASSNVFYVLSIAGFLRNIPIYPTLDEALKSFS
ncbi:MAG: STAS domain-containing protein [Chloroflexi bacterium]|nr:STAS domain-containing protein [Chloroflexota bacterium]